MNDITQRQPAVADLPEARRAAVESGLAQFNQIAHERDTAVRERDTLKVNLQRADTENETLKKQLDETNSNFSKHFESMREQFTQETDALRERYEAQLNEAQSRVNTLQAERDQAVADRAFLESVLSIIKSSIEKAELPPPVRDTRRRPSVVARTGDQSQGGQGGQS